MLFRSKAVTVASGENRMFNYRHHRRCRCVASQSQPHTEEDQYLEGQRLGLRTVSNERGNVRNLFPGIHVS